MAFKEIFLALLVSAAIVAAVPSRGDKKYKVVCYFGAWASYRKGDGNFIIEHIDPFLCTHLIYAFATVEENQIVVSDSYRDLTENWGLGAFERFNWLKKANPELKTLISIGGWTEGSTEYSKMASNAASRATFIKSVLAFLKKHKFDGLDVDWEYPANRGGAPADKQNFVALLKELKEALKPQGLLLTAAVAAGKAIIDTAYDIPNVAKHLDFINLMAYDFHASSESKTAHHAPLYARPEESDEEKSLNVDYAVKYWIKNGAPSDKIILGMGMYGRSFTLASASSNGLGAPTTELGAPGPLTKEKGMLGYNEICLYLKQDWKEVFVSKLEAPYCYKGNQWVGYDNEDSIREKVDYLIQANLGGGMVWSLDTDDFRGSCSNGMYPMLKTIANSLNGPQIREVSKPDSSTGDMKCVKVGYMWSSSNCSVFHVCLEQENGFSKHTYNCGDEGAAFDLINFSCTADYNVVGC